MGFGGGRLVISLDLELHWGVSDLYPIEAVRRRLHGARRVIPPLLSLFEEYNVRATWAATGMLLCESRDEIEASVSNQDRPRYKSRPLSNWNILNAVGRNESEDPYHFAGSLIEQIRLTVGQEIATHTFSHFYALEPRATLASFEADLNAALTVADRRGINVRSIVFPRNQYSDAHVGLCARYGLRAFRGTPPRWMYNSVSSKGESMHRRAARMIETHVPLLGAGNLYESDSCRTGHGAADIAASRFLQPAERFGWVLEQRLRLIESEMRAAARLGRLYHLWWHPHNFGVEPDANLAQLRRILDVYRDLTGKGMQSVTMAEAAEEVERHEAHLAAGARQ